MHNRSVRRSKTFEFGHDPIELIYPESKPDESKSNESKIEELKQQTLISMTDRKNILQNVNTFCLLLNFVFFGTLIYFKFISNKIRFIGYDGVDKLSVNISICDESVYKINWNKCCFRQFSYNYLYSIGFTDIESDPYFYLDSDRTKTTKLIYKNNKGHMNNNNKCYFLHIHQGSFLYTKKMGIFHKTKLYETVIKYCKKNNITKECELWLPKTYNFRNVNEKIDFFKQLPCNNEKNRNWILKTNDHAGKGIKVINDSNYFRKSYLTINQQFTSNPKCVVGNIGKINHKKNIIAQQFISNVLTINNKKFHIRSFFILANYQNPYIVLYAGSIIIKSTDGYDLKQFAESNIITNRAISKKNKNTTQYDWVWNMKQFESYCVAQKFDVHINTLIHKIKNIAKIIFLSGKLVQTNITKTADMNEQHYLLTALDLLITNDFEIKILELNARIKSTFIPKQCDDDNIVETNWQCKMGKMIEEEMIDTQIEMAIKKLTANKINKLQSLKHLKPIIWE